MAKIERKKWEQFLADWATGQKYKHQRLGQAFINSFYDEIKDIMGPTVVEHNMTVHIDPTLFNTTNTDLAIYCIESKYIEDYKEK